MTLNEIKAALRAAGIDNFSGEAHILIKEFFKTDAPDPNADFDCPALKDAVRRRTAREPLQYILGKWGFYKEEYFVTPDCLIPRTDTEILVETLICRAARGDRFLDLCTGSGCIAISLARARPDLSGRGGRSKFSRAGIGKKKRRAQRRSKPFVFLPGCDRARGFFRAVFLHLRKSALHLHRRAGRACA